MAYKFNTLTGLVGFGSAPVPQAFSRPVFTLGLDLDPVTEVVIAVPNGIVDGDLLVACTCSYISSNYSVNVSFTTLNENLNNTLRSTLSWRQASSEPATYTFTNADSANNMAVSLCWIPKSATGAPHQWARQSNSSNSITATCPTVTTTINNCMMLNFVCMRNANTVAPTPVASVSADGYVRGINLVGLAPGHELLVGQGATGTRAWTKAGTGRDTCYTVAVAPE